MRSANCENECGDDAVHDSTTGGVPRGRRRTPWIVLAAMAFAFIALGAKSSTDHGGQPAAPRNVIFILSDDHRYDFMGFMPGAPDFLHTPSMDRMAAEGAHLAKGDWQANERKRP